jgi:hypothetical protein
MSDKPPITPVLRPTGAVRDASEPTKAKEVLKLHGYNAIHQTLRNTAKGSATCRLVVDDDAGRVRLLCHFGISLAWSAKMIPF